MFEITFFLSGCEDWKIRLWKIPKDGLTETLEEPFQTLEGIHIWNIFKIFFKHEKFQCTYVYFLSKWKDYYYLSQLNEKKHQIPISRSQTKSHNCSISPDRK